MKKIIYELINSSIGGVDVYRYKDATWLIFTDETRWVVEMTDGGTLWYNYKFFNDIMKYVSMDPKEYEGYITGWVNDYFFKDVKEVRDSLSYRVQNRAENLTWRIVKDVKPNVVFHGINNSDMSFVACNGNSTHIHKIVEEGIKKTEERGKGHGNEFEWHTRAVINKGVKNTYPDRNSGDYDWSDEFDTDKVIKVGVKL
jgi:hypothetical protein